VLGDLRLRLDAGTARAVPAHVTVHFPFVPAGGLDGNVLDRVAGALAGAAPFGHRLSRTTWLDDRVLFLAPDDERPFRDRADRVHAAFPEHPPFRRRLRRRRPPPDVGQGRPVGELRGAERQVLPRLPVGGSAREVVQTEASPGGRWRQWRVFPLAGVSRR
jgi:hypothetical protein